MDTIYALASGSLPCGVAIIRLSGPDSFKVAQSLTGALPKIRSTGLRTIRNRNDEPIDQGVIICFAAPHSFTGEDVVEFQLHGSVAVVNALNMALDSFDNVRQAEAGEFTQRAFINGQFDLTAAEGLASLIDAETEAQRKYALRQANGEAFDVYRSWQDELLRLRALSEAEIDFSDEDGVSDNIGHSIGRDSMILAHTIENHLSNSSGSRQIRDGVVVVIAGPPNAGKSSLFNALIGEDRVLVSPTAGTTRDYIEARLDLNGILIRLIDTAGLRDSTDVLENAGIERSYAVIKDADIVVALHSNDDEHIELQNPQTTTLSFTSKRDILPNHGEVSMSNDASIMRVRDAIRAAAMERVSTSLLSTPISARHVSYLQDCALELTMVGDDSFDHALRGEKLRSAAEKLGRITGEFGVEDVLGAIFSRFCIGK